ncbi:MAG: ester cyclase [Chromatiales bacterium]|nr:ester cyclase [Chromatiales bacterium]
MNALETAKKMFDAWNSRDWDTIRSSLHVECLYTGPDGQQARGIEDCLKVGWISFATGFPDGRVELKASYNGGDVIVTEFTFKATHTGIWEGIAPTGKKVEVDLCNVMVFRDGKVFRERDYLDTLGLFGQLGIVQMPKL